MHPSYTVEVFANIDLYLFIFQPDLITNWLSNLVYSLTGHSFCDRHGWDATRLCTDNEAFTSMSCLKMAVQDELRNLSCLSTTEKKMRWWVWSLNLNQVKFIDWKIWNTDNRERCSSFSHKQSTSSLCNFSCQKFYWLPWYLQLRVDMWWLNH